LGLGDELMDEVLCKFGLVEMAKGKMVGNHENWREPLSLYFFFFCFCVILLFAGYEL
jgi:hypothetical protein